MLLNFFFFKIKNKKNILLKFLKVPCLHGTEKLRIRNEMDSDEKEYEKGESES